MFYRLSLHDSALYYHNIALSIRKEINDSTGIASSLSNIANVYLYRTKFKEALMNYQEALSYIDTVKVNSYLASITNNIGYSNERTGNYPRAMQYYIKALGYYEILQDKRGQSKLNSSIGNLHIDLDNFAEAEMYLLKGLELFTELRDKMGIADAYLYLGRLYEEKDDKQMSLHYFNLSLELKKVIKDINGIADCYHNLGLIFTDLKKNDTALMMFDLARYNYQESENNYGLATLHNNISNFYFQNKQYRKAYAEAEKANEIASGYGGILEKYDAVKTMAASMQKLGKYKEANALLHDYIVLKDSLLGKQKNEAVLEMTIKYESEKNQRNIDRQRLLLEQRDLQIAKAASEQRSSRMVTNTLILIALLLVFIVIWVYRSFVTSKQLNAKLQNHRKNILDKNEELAKLNEELETQRDQIERTHHTVLEKSNQLEQAHAKIQTSVEYAEYIQQAVLPSKKFIQQILKESFVLYLPKEKVGGDFYYIEEFDNLIYVAVGDCSGHGIPGGFMNMLGMSILRHALAEQEALNPAMVLENMRTGFIEAMNQTNSNSTYHEGIDIALLLYDKDALECTFAGARSQFIHVSENEHTVYKGANASVAQSPNPLPFVNQKIPFRKGDAIYMFTDGVVDQFNPFGEKFGRKRLVDLCLKYSNQPMAYQREVFFQSFKSWKDNYEQIDDALVLGFKI
jgi:serine phosphatase RsbU (regulator of sigma subunit)